MRRPLSILALVLVGAVCVPAGAHAAFGIEEFDVTFTGEDGSPAAQAGSHPFAFNTSLGVNLSGEETDGRLKELFLDLPPGFVADATASPRCTGEEFIDETCPRASVVGTSASSFVEPGHWETAPVYHLVPLEGEPMRLGFRVAGVENVYVDVGLSPEPPYNPIATVGDGPETIDVFGVEIQLWGVPAASAHDLQRGGPVDGQLRPFLTLPTSCEGPQETFYEALSWEGDEDWGGTLTHDGAGDPIGFSGCHKLGFSPQMSTHLTTEAAQSPTGLDLDLKVFDNGLVSPTGIAQSQIRDLELALPEGVAANPAAVQAGAACSEEDLEAETADSGPGEGCPAASRVGTALVESPLIEGPIEGVLNWATPYENLAEDAAMAIYVVLKSPALGIVIAQPVGFETDPETGRLVALAEEMPQLPFSHLSLHLGDGESGPLISPAFCGDYEAEANFVAWSGEGPFRLTFSSPIVTGPDGGPCPSGSGEPGCDACEGPAPHLSGAGAAGNSAKPHPPGSARRHCRKGQRRVRRHGRARCVKRRHGKHR